MGHPGHPELLLEHLSAAPAVEGRHAADRGHGLVQVVDDEPGARVGQDLADQDAQIDSRSYRR